MIRSGISWIIFDILQRINENVEKCGHQQENAFLLAGIEAPYKVIPAKGWTPYKVTNPLPLARRDAFVPHALILSPGRDVLRLSQSEETSPVQWPAHCPKPGKLALEMTNGRSPRVTFSPLHAIDDSYLVTQASRHTTADTRLLTHDPETRLLTHDSWHTTPESWHTAPDTRQETNVFWPANPDTRLVTRQVLCFVFIHFLLLFKKISYIHEQQVWYISVNCGKTAQLTC